MIAEIVGQSAYPPYCVSLYLLKKHPPPLPTFPHPGMPEPPMSRLQETLAQLKKKKKP